MSPLHLLFGHVAVAAATLTEILQQQAHLRPLEHTRRVDIIAGEKLACLCLAHNRVGVVQ